MQIDPQLQTSLAHAITKKGKESSATASVAYSKSGQSYRGGSIASDTNLLDISSEQCALVQAIHHTDFSIERIVTMSESGTVSPLVIKCIADFEARTGSVISYEIINSKGESVFSTQSPSSTIPFYRPQTSKLPQIDSAQYEENSTASNTDDEDVISNIKNAALLGLDRGFGSGSGSSYSAALRSADGRIFFGGQYSSLDMRLGLHAEMAVFVSAYMAGARDFTHLGVISTKYPDTPCEMCGLCRQFSFEMFSKIGSSPSLVSFAKDTDTHTSYTIEDLLPHPWTSKKW